MFIVMTGDPFDDDCEIFGPFKTERAAQAVAAAGSSEESEWSAVAVSAPQPGASNNGTAVVCRGYAVIPGQWEPGIGGVMEPYFVGPFLDLDAARAWAIADGLDADAAFEIKRLDQDDSDEP
jgi:hypothetical protein